MICKWLYMWPCQLLWAGVTWETASSLMRILLLILLYSVSRVPRTLRADWKECVGVISVILVVETRFVRRKGTNRTS